MTIDVNIYRRTLEAHKMSLLDDRSDARQKVTLVALASEVPIIAVALFALRPDVLGELSELRKLVETITFFYRYTQVLGWSDESPQSQP